MLYDPKWEVKPNPLSIEALIAWLETKPADEEYTFLFPDRCLLGQYLGMELSMKATAASIEDPHSQLGRLYTIASGGASGRHTFGAALKRARHARNICGND